MRPVPLAAALLLLTTHAVPCQSLVRDINTTGTPPRDEIREMVRAGNGVFFSASHYDIGGAELWFSDGTSAGTRLVRDLYPGPHGANPQNLTAAGNRCFFLAQSPETVRKALFVSDGTPTGTRFVREFRLEPTGLTALDSNRVVFAAYSTTSGRELWVSDGTAAGTRQLRDIRPGSGHGVETDVQLTLARGMLYFAANDGVRGSELWSTNGLTSGTRRVADLQPGSGSSSPRDIIPVAGGISFTAWQATTGREIWHWNGRSFSLVETAPGPADGAPEDLVAGGFDTVYLTAWDRAGGRELWFATTSSARRVTQINPGAASSDPRDITMIGTTPWFSAFSPNHGRELWRLDPRLGAVLVANVVTGPTSSSPYGITWLGLGKPVLFSAEVSGTRKLYSTTGTGATLLSERGMSPPPLVLYRPGDTFPLLYRSYEGRDEIWTSDGTVAGTRLVKVLNPGNGSSLPRDMFYHAVLDRFFFVAEDETHGRELWTSDGSTTGTRRLTDIHRLAGDSSIHSLTAFGDKLMFFAQDGTQASLWQSDGTAAGTRTTVRGLSGSSMVSVSAAGTASEKLLIQASFPSPQNLLSWDGARLETLTSLRVELGPALHLTSVGSRAYFMQSRRSPSEVELWSTDGTRARTQRIKTMSARALPTWTCNVGQRLYFDLDDGVHGAELWTSVGLATNTLLVQDIVPGSVGSNPSQGIALGPEVVFSAATAAAGRELWRANGSRALILRDIAAGSSSSDPRHLVRADDTIYFSAWTQTQGRELWMTRGRTSSTNLVRDIEPGTSSSNPTEIARADSGRRVLFAAGQAASGYEVWTSDGTSGGTRLLADQRSGALGTYPREFTLAGDTVFLSSYEGTDGRELYQIPAATIGGTIAAPFGRGGVGLSGRPFVRARDLPRVGTRTFAVDLVNAPPNSLSLLWLAQSTLALPIAHDCTLRTPAVLLTVAVPTNAGGTASVPLPIPQSQRLLGKNLFVQYGVVDRQGCFANLVNLSDAMRILIGL